MQQHTHYSNTSAWQDAIQSLSTVPALPYQLLFAPLFLSIHISIFPYLFIPPTAGVFVLEQQKLFFFSSPLGYLGWGVGGWEISPESRTEGILCWTRERRRVRRAGDIGGETRMQQIQVKALCRYQKQVQESRTHTGFNVYVMVKREWSWGLKRRIWRQEKDDLCVIR